jgi:hypothetical protein
MIEDNITDITTAPAEQPVPIIDEQTQQVDVAVTPEAPPPVEPEKPAAVLKDIDFFNNNVDWHNSNLAEGEKALVKYKFAQDIPDEEYNVLKTKVEVGTLNEYNTLSTKYPEYKAGKAEKYEDINDENYTKLHDANKAQSELTQYNEIVKQLSNKRGLPKIKDRKDLTPELLGKAQSAAVEDLNADMAKRSKNLGVEFKPFESYKAIDWESVGNTYKLSSVKEANGSISKLKEVYGSISPEIKKFPEFSSYEDFEKRKGDLVSLEKTASATKSKAEQNKFLETANNQVALVNKELGANIPMYTDFQTAVSAFKPGKDGTIPFNKKIEGIQTTKGLEDFRNQISSIQPTGGARGDIAAPNLATDNSAFNLEQKRKEYLARYNERANNIAMLSKKTLKTGDNAPIFTDEDVALTSPYTKMASIQPSPSVDANWLNREGKFGLGAPNIRMDEVSGRPIDPRVDELSELVSKTNKRANEISVTLKDKVAEYNDYAKEIEGIQNSGVAITPNQKLHLDNLKEDVDNLRLGLDAMSSSAVSKYNNLFSIQKLQGSTSGDVARILLGIPADIGKVVLQSLSTIAPYITKDFSQEEAADLNKNLDKKASSLIQAVSQSSPEHLQSAGTFMKGLEFSASMLPYMALGEVKLAAGATASEALMLISSFSSVKQSLYENPETNKLSEDEKNVVALGNAIVSTATMSLGLKAGIKGKGNLGIGINNMTYNVFKGLPSTMSGVKTILSSALAGGVSFGTLDFASTVAGEGLNKVVNFAKGEEIYDKKSVYKVLGDAFERGAEGLFNGTFFGTITGMHSAVKEGVLNRSVFNTVDEMYSNPAAFSIAHNEIRRKLALGEITPKEAASQFKSITIFKDIMSQIPEDLNRTDRYTVTKLLLQNKNYEAQMSGLNESFAAQFKKRIENNNKEIEKIAASHIERTLSEKEAPTTEEGKPTEATPVEPTEEQKAAKGRVDDFVEELATSNPDAHERAKEDPAPVIDELIESSKEKLDAAEPEEKAPIQKEIDRLEGIKKDVELGNEKPVEEPAAKQEAKPLGEVSDSEHKEFIDTGKVDPKRLENIASKVKNKEPLSDREKDIFTNKTAEINNLIREQAEPKAEKSDPGGAKFTPELEAQMPQHKPMFSALKKGLAAIKSIMPNIDVRFHDTHESMQKVLDAYDVNGKDGKRRRAENVKGNYGVFKDGSIRIDLNLAAGANRITVAHEIGHVILEKAFGDNPKMFDYLKKQVASLVGETKNQYLLNFIKMYGESKKSNEYLTELAAIMGGGKIEPTVMRKVAAAINKIINKVSLGRFSPFEDIKNSNELVDYFSSLSEALHAGKEIKLNEKYTPKEETVSEKEETVSEKEANEKPRSTQQLKDEERVLMSAKSILSRQNEMIPPKGEKQNNSNIAKMLQEKAIEFWGGEIVTSDTITEEQERIIVDNIAEEVELELKKQGNAEDWYTKEIELALEIISVMHPEINDRKEAVKIEAFANEPIPEDAASFAVRLPLAITSQNLDVAVNSRYGEEQYDAFKKTGRFDSSKEYGSKAESISGNLELANVFIDNVGLSGLMDFCKKEFKVSDLEKEVSKLINKKVTISGYRNDVVYGSAIFGPKIGQGFLQNLMGNYYPVTIDLWARRTWGRMTGDVVGDGVTKDRLDRLVIETKKSKNFIGVEIPEIVKKYNSKKIESLLDGNEELKSEFLDFASKVKAKGDSMYKSIHDQPMTKLMYEDFLSGKKSYEQIASELSKYRSKAKEKYNEYAKKERLNKRKPLSLDKWLSDFYNSKGMSSHPTNKEISKRKPEWHKSAVVIINDLKPIDVPTDRDRQVISRIINKVRAKLGNKNIVLTNADIQAIIWFPEKDIWAVLGGEKESTKKLSYGGEFKKIAEERGLGEQATAAEERVKSRGASRTSSTLEQGSNEKTGGAVNEAKPKSKQSLVDDAKMTKDMTEDEKGNYLFYHYSPGKIPSIDPRHFGKNLRTGRDERPGIGVSMYYTRPDRRDVGGSYGYVVRVPKDKVYPFNSDPMNLMDKAKATFEKMYPGQAFDKNKQVAFVSQEAAKAGYDMTVAKWGNDLRAQTTKVMKGETYEKPHPDYHTSTVFNPKLEKYVANENKPKSKQQLSEDVAKKINDIDESSVEKIKKYLPTDVPSPKNTEKAYKLFRVDPKKPGELFPLFVKSDKSVPFGTWTKAEVGDQTTSKSGKTMVKSKLGNLAYRPGWHSGDIPIATHIGEKKNASDIKPSIRPNNQVWAEVEVANDKDWQSEANKRAELNKNGEVIARTAHITDQVPEGGFYKYKTNSNMSGSWMISGEMKVVRILSDKEVIDINKKANTKDLYREQPFDLKKHGFDDNGVPVNIKEINSKKIAEAYAEAKANGSNPELVKAVEQSIAETPKSKQQLSDKGEEFKDEMQGFFNRNKETGEKKDIIENAIADAEKKWAPWIRNNQEEYNAAVMGFKEDNNIKIKAAPSQAKISGEKPKEITITERTALKDQIKLEINAANKAAKSVVDARKEIIELVKGSKDSFTRADYEKIIDIMSNVKDEASINKAFDKIVEIEKNSKASDIKEVSEFKELKDKVRLIYEAAKEATKAVVDARKTITDLVKGRKDSFTRGDYEKIMSVISSVKDEASLNKAFDKIVEIEKNSKSGDIKEVSEFKELKEKVRLIYEAAKEGKKSVVDPLREIAAKLKEMQGRGQITANQAKALLNRFANVNTANPDMVDRYLDYAEKVFNDADYADKLNEAREINKRVKKAIKSKEVESQLRMAAKKFTEANVTKVEDIDAHLEMGRRLLDATSSSGIGVKEGEISDRTRKAINIKELSDYTDEVAQKIAEMDEANLLEATGIDVRSEEPDTVAPSIEDYIRDRFNAMADSIRDMIKSGISPIDGEKYDLSDEDKIKLSKLVKMTADDIVDPKDKIRALEAMDHLLTNGVMGRIPYILNKIKMSKDVDRGISERVRVTRGKVGLLAIENAVQGIRKFLSFSGNSKFYHALLRNSAKRIDNVIKNYPGFEIFNNGIKQIAQGWSSYKTDLNTMNSDKLKNELVKSMGGDFNKVIESGFKMTMYLRQLEHESNPGSKKSPPAMAFVEKSIEASMSGKHPMNEKSAKLLKKLSELYSTDGNIDSKKIWDSFSPAEKKVVEGIRKLYDTLTPYAQKVASEIHDQPFDPFENYTTIVTQNTSRGAEQVLNERGELNAAIGITPAGSIKTKAGQIEERTGQASPINFDPFSSANKAVRNVMLDYHMTLPLRTMSKITDGFIAKSLEMYKADPSKENESRLLFAKAMRKTFEDVLEATLSRSFFHRDIWSDVRDYVSRASTTYMLSNPSKSASEAVSNLSYVVPNYPEEMALGITEYKDYSLNGVGGEIMRNLNSYATDRAYPHGTLSGAFLSTESYEISTNDMQNVRGFAVNAATKAYYNSLMAPQKGLRAVSETMMTAPDLAIIRPLWFGSMAKNFKKLTGQDIDFEAIAKNDVNYLDKFEDALNKSRDIADKNVTDTGAAKNPWLMSPITVKRHGTLLGQTQNYLANYGRNEYEITTDAIIAMHRGGKMSRADAAKQISGVLLRAGTYTAMRGAIASGLAAAGIAMHHFLYDDDDKDELTQAITEGKPDSKETRKIAAKNQINFLTKTSPRIPGIDPSIDLNNVMMTSDKNKFTMKELQERASDENTFSDNFIKGVGSFVAQGVLGRNFGNIQNKFFTSTAVEYLNAKYLHPEDYNRYKNNILYSSWPDFNSKDAYQKTVEAAVGPYGKASSAAWAVGTSINDYLESQSKIKAIDENLRKIESGEKVPFEQSGLDYRDKLIKEKNKLIRDNKKNVPAYFRDAIISGLATMGTLPGAKDFENVMTKAMKPTMVELSDYDELKEKYKFYKGSVKGTIWGTPGEKDDRESEYYKMTHAGFDLIPEGWIKK